MPAAPAARRRACVLDLARPLGGGRCSALEGLRVSSKPRKAEMTFRVQRYRCRTCIYRKDSALDLKVLEDAVRDRYVGFRGYRICHHSKALCCRGFWDRHKDEFQL